MSRTQFYRLPMGEHPGWQVLTVDREGTAHVHNEALAATMFLPFAALIAVEPLTGFAAVAGEAEATRIPPVASPAATIAPVVAADRKDAGGVIASPSATGAPLVGVLEAHRDGGTVRGHPTHAGNGISVGPFDSGTPTTPIKGARNTDPDTAHEAALAQSDPNNRRLYDHILALIFEHGPLTDWQLAEKLTARLGERIIATSAGKRRGELRDMGLLVDSGHRGPTETGPRKAARWGLTPAGEAEVAA